MGQQMTFLKFRDNNRTKPSELLPCTYFFLPAEQEILSLTFVSCEIDYMIDQNDILTHSCKQPKTSAEVLPFTGLSTMNSKENDRVTELDIVMWDSTWPIVQTSSTPFQ
jgi:hypothetical protein